MKYLLIAFLVASMPYPLPLKTELYLQKMYLLKGQLVIEKVEYYPDNGQYTGRRITEYYGSDQGPVKLVKSIESNDKEPKKK